MNKLLQEVDNYCKRELLKYGIPPLFEYNEINKIGVDLAQKLKADVVIVELGTRLMDVKLGEARKLGRREDHIKMSSDVAKRFLSKNKVDKKMMDKVINCVEAHHATEKYMCLEAEICANADTHRFLMPRLFLHRFYERVGDRSIEEIIDLFEIKLEEKHKIVTLEICKDMLENNYRILKEIIKAAKQ